MRLSTIRETKQRLIAALEDPTGGAPARTTSIALDRYLDPEALEQEQAVLFRRRPIVVAHASELAQPGQYIAEDLGGVPIVVVRDESSRLRAFVNACRHRSSRLLSAERGVCPKLISCPYHG